VPEPAQTGFAPGPQSPAGPAQRLHAEPGDTLIIEVGGMAGLPRIGMIIAVPGRDGAPPYLVRWTTGDYDSRVTPGTDARIERRSPEPQR
jgi:hypothetical protein